MFRAITRTWVGDAVVAAAVGGLMEFEVVSDHLHPYAASAPAFAAYALTYVVRRRAPLLPLAVGSVGQVLITLAGVSLHEPFSPMIMAFLVLYSVGLYEPGRRALGGLAFMLLTTWGAVAIAQHNGEHYGGTDYGFITVLFVAPWFVGRAIRSRVHEATELTRRAARLEEERVLAVAEERARIARELHDVIAHSVSVMVVQAGAAAEMLKRTPDRAREPLDAVQETGRQALVEMTRLVGLLRDDSEELGLAPQPGLAELDDLVAQVREAGLPVELRIEGEARPVPLGVDLSAYRVVQEALTNALKHAGDARAEVLLRYGRDALELEVRDDGPGSANGHSGGHGLVGMRERVHVFGGEFHAGPRSEGGFAVRASLPLEATA